MDERLKRIRESEKKSHMEIYSNEQLYQTDSWLKKPIKTVQELIPLFREYKKLRVLDLGCGVGRNCIAVASEFMGTDSGCKTENSEYKGAECVVEGVDILPLAIEKLLQNAVEHGVSEQVCGIVAPIEDYTIRKNYYDLILAISALEHVDTEESFASKLLEIKEGICEKGVVCLVINSDVREHNKENGSPIQAQFEVNLGTEELQKILTTTFEGWTVLKSTVQEQRYDIPREWGISALTSNVVTFVARR